jgi:hypothetical protein
MPLYNLHIYREMRLVFDNIEADTPQAAAAIGRERLTTDAVEIDDCEGETLSALVDVVGDEEYEHSVFIDFEAERVRKIARQLLDALKRLLTSYCYWLPRYGDSEAVNSAMVKDAKELIAQAEDDGITPDAPQMDVHAVLAGRREIAAIWNIKDVQSVRPDLSNEQAWEVLQTALSRHDAGTGINWLVLKCHADEMFGNAPASADDQGGRHECHR